LKEILGDETPSKGRPPNETHAFQKLDQMIIEVDRWADDAEMAHEFGEAGHAFILARRIG